MGYMVTQRRSSSNRDGSMRGGVWRALRNGVASVFRRAGRAYDFDPATRKWMLSALATLWVFTSLSSILGRDGRGGIPMIAVIVVVQFAVIATSFLAPLYLADLFAGNEGVMQRLLRWFGVGGLPEGAYVAWLLTGRVRRVGVMDPFVHQRSLEQIEAFDDAARHVNTADLALVTRVLWRRRCRVVDRWRESIGVYASSGRLEQDLRSMLLEAEPTGEHQRVCAVVRGWYGTDKASSIWIGHHRIAGEVGDRFALVEGDVEMVRRVNAIHLGRWDGDVEEPAMCELYGNEPLEVAAALWDPNPGALLHHPARAITAAVRLERARLRRGHSGPVEAVPGDDVRR